MRREPGNERLGEQLDVPFSRSQRRKQQGHHVEPVEQILAELAAGDRRGEIHVARPDDPDVDLTRALASHPADLTGLERPQQLGLQLERQGSDLVQKDCAPVGQLEQPGLGCDRSGEGAPLVAEELALQQVCGNRRAIDLDKGSRGSRAVIVQRPGQQLLSGAGFSTDQHRNVSMLRHPPGLLDDLPECGTAPDDGAES